MVFVNDVFQTNVGDVGVDLGGVDVGVSEHELYGTQIDAVVDEVGGEGVAQAVRAERGDAGGFGVVFDNHPRELAGNTAAFLADEDFVADFVFEQQRARFGAIAFDPVNGFFAHRHDTQFIAFAYGADAAAVEVEVAQLELDGFGYAQTCGVHDFEQGFVAQAVRRVGIGRGEQAFDLRFGNQGGQFLRLFRGFEETGRVVRPPLGLFQPGV